MISCGKICHRREHCIGIRLMWEPSISDTKQRWWADIACDNEKKKVKTAVAVAYEPGDKAPKILASGRGEVAEKIIAKAKENDVPFYKDNKLAETLSKLEIGDAIPPELYEVVAEILVFVDDMDKMKAKLQQADMLS